MFVYCPYYLILPATPWTVGPPCNVAMCSCPRALKDKVEELEQQVLHMPLSSYAPAKELPGQLLANALHEEQSGPEKKRPKRTTAQ